MSSEKSSRSIFVGNIPYEATEEQLRDIFVQAGPIIAFRLVYDRETGKPKGYGFCEYQDAETAQSAIRNLSNVEINGRNLRIGFASGEQTHQAIDSFQSYIQPDTERIHGEPVEPERAPEAISRAVASLPPEQMFELMKQMKVCIQNNPNEARNMLLQNPQLAYALLQAQIIMKIVDPQQAMSLLHRPRDQGPMPVPPGLQPTPQAPVPVAQVAPPAMPPGPPPPSMPSQAPPPMMVGMGNGMPPMVPGPPPGMVPPPLGMPMPMPPMASHHPPPQQPIPPPQIVPPAPPPQQQQQQQQQQPSRLVDPRMMRNQSQSSQAAAPSQQTPAQNATGATAGGGDQERNQLIAQVLSLRPEQIEMLPPEQRQSILLLKEQIAKGAAPF